MRITLQAVTAGAEVLASCSAQPVDLYPEDPEAIAAIDALLDVTVEGTRNVDADQVLAMVSRDGEFTFINGDLMLTGLETIREDFEDT